MSLSKELSKVFSSNRPAMGGFDDFQKEMGKMFERFFHTDPFAQYGLPSRLKGFDLSPTVDVAETPDAYEITVELPGISEKDVKVTIDNDILSISGEKKAEKTEEKKNVHISERHYGSFQRQFSLPDDADQSKINADFKNGILKISLGRSKKPKETARQIDVKAA